jgi:hypothetical protein
MQGKGKYFHKYQQLHPLARLFLLLYNLLSSLCENFVVNMSERSGCVRDEMKNKSRRIFIIHSWRKLHEVKAAAATII